MRIGGLASGMDIDSIVKNLMQAERMPLQKLQQDKQRLEWQRDDYRTINTMMMDFRSTLTQMKLSTSFRARAVTSSDEARVTATASSAAMQGSYSIDSVKSLAKAESWVSTATSKIDPTKAMGEQSITGLTWAEGAVGKKTLNGNGTATYQLDLNGATIETALTEKMKVKVDGKVFNIIDSGASFEAGKNQVKISDSGELTFGSAVSANSKITVDYVADKHIKDLKIADGTKTLNLGTKMIAQDAEFKLEAGANTYTLVDPDPSATDDRTKMALKDQNDQVVGEVNLNTGVVTLNDNVSGETNVKATFRQQYSHMSLTTHSSKGEITESFLFTPDQTLNSVFEQVNKSSLGLSMFMDTQTNQVSMMRTETGRYNTDAAEADVSFKDMSFVTDVLGFSFTSMDDPNDSLKVNAQNAEFTVNGLTTNRTTNTFNMNGVTFTLNQTFEPGNPVTMNINNDNDQVFDNIKEFVEKYNTLIAAINEKATEERYRDFNPLSDEEREALTDKQQEQFEEKARSGLLRRDPILTGALSSMRMDFYSPVSNDQTNSAFSQLAAIGITTTSNFREGGKLEINEAKLKEALSNDPEAVENLFRSGSDATDKSAKGILHRLTDSVNVAMDQFRQKAGNQFSTNQQFSIGRNLNDVDDRIKRFEDRVIQVEDRYWRQFTAMEKAIQQANNQSAYLMQQFSSGF
ncbi:flagellar filament capping protein FliD [Jeotgalibacillus sp. JSM ZJ347]|uniref:flagellar filament capping protein FliD n=1 Tax=Jeotgalibacillus sp. JSM ZJ347 TaxID=3342117 RepID=UPI0035A832F0